jgi:hypothetical protein
MCKIAMCLPSNTMFRWTFSSNPRILYGHKQPICLTRSELLRYSSRIEGWPPSLAAFCLMRFGITIHGGNMTGKSHSIFDAVKHAVFEDEPEPPHTSAAGSPNQAAFAAPLGHSAVETPPEVSPVHPVESGTVPDDDAVYQRLLAKTNFEATDAATTIHKFLDPLKAIPDSVMPPNIKFKTAVVQAGAQAGLTEESILAAFDRLKAQLQLEQDAFADKAHQFEAREIASRQDRIGQISSQISALQQELANLSGELVAAQGKSSHVQSQFAAAAQRRAMEIEQQKAQYASLLKG